MVVAVTVQRSALYLVGGLQKLLFSVLLAVLLLVGLWWMPLLIPAFIVLVCAYDLLVNARRASTRASQVLMLLLALLVVVGGLGMWRLLQLQNGQWLFLLLVTSVVLTDASAQVVGRRFGVPGTFLPSISPNKSVQGVLGSWYVGAMFFLAVMVVAFGVQPPLAPWYAFTLALAPFVSTFGDIFASAVKRSLGVKDFGTYLGCTGGLMDRVDSWVAVFAVMVVLQGLPF